MEHITCLWKALLSILVCVWGLYWMYSLNVLEQLTSSRSHLWKCVALDFFFFFYQTWMYLDGKEFSCNVGDLGSIPGSGRSPAEGNGNNIPVFLPGEFHGQRSLMGYIPWDHEELNMTEQLTHKYVLTYKIKKKMIPFIKLRYAASRHKW